MDDGDQIDLTRAAPFRLGPLTVEPALRQVTAATVETLEPRVMQVLVALVRVNGATVSRDDLIRQCWDGRIVGEDSISRVIARLRRLAEERGGGAFGIETITKVGYRLVGSPAVLLDPGAKRIDEARTLSLAPSSARTPRRSRNWLLGGVAAAAAAAAAAIALFSWPQAAPAQPLIILDPFAASGDLPVGYAAALRADMLASNQSNGSGATGTPARVVTSADNGRSAGFRLTGSVSGEGGVAGIHIELREPGGSTPVWAARYEVQPTAAKRAGAADEIVAATLCIIDATRERPVPLTGAALMHWAEYCAEDSKSNPDENRVVELLRATVAAEPRYLDGWTRLAVFLRETSHPATRAEALAVRVAGRTALAHAEALDPDDARVLVAKAQLADPRDYAEQEWLLSRAIVRLGEDAGQNQFYGYFLSGLGRLDEALKAHRAALGVNPGNPLEAYNVARMLAATGRTGEAQAMLKRLAATQSDAERVRRLQLSIALAAKDWAFASQVNETMADGDFKLAMRPLIAALARGDGRAAFEAGARFEQLASSPVTLAAPVVIALSVSGRDRAAIAAAERNIGPESFASTIIPLYWSTFARARQMPEFAALVTRLGLVDYWRKSGHPPDFCLAADAPTLCAKLKAIG